MKWKTDSLKNVCDIVSGATPKSGNSSYWDGEIDWVTPTDLSRLQKKDLTGSLRKISTSGLESCSARMLPVNSVLVSSRAPIGLVAINKVPVCTNQGFKSLIPDKDELDANFLYWWVKYNAQKLQNLGRGATFKEISKEVIGSVEVCYPNSLAEQKRIAAILDKADAIRRKRQQALQLTDDFLRSTFLKMFGDPGSNSKKMPVAPLSQFGKIVTGNTPPRKDSANYGGGMEWIKSDNINTPSFYLTEATERLSEKGGVIARSVEPNSILVTCIAGSRHCIGNAAISERVVAFNQQINAITPSNETDYRFLFVQFLVGQEYVRQSSTNSMKGMISKSVFSSIRFIKPPHSSQLKFGEKFDQIMTWQRKQSRQSDQAEDLFKSLQQRAFTGQL